MINIEIKKGEEIIEKVTRTLKEKQIKTGILSLIGAVDSCCISTMQKDDALKDILTQYHEPLELSSIGELVNGKPHIHVTLGREDNSALFGHLHWGKVKSWFVNVYINSY